METTDTKNRASENKTSRALCFSHLEFDQACSRNGWSDENIPEEIAFISIICTPSCQEYYLGETEEHYFKLPHPNVLNLEFDDISRDWIDWKGHRFYGFSEDQARESYKFIQKNLGKDFWVHCRAGQSRSQAFIRFLLDCFPDYQWETKADNPCETPNIDVLSKLKRCWWENLDGEI